MKDEIKQLVEFAVRLRALKRSHWDQKDSVSTPYGKIEFKYSVDFIFGEELDVDYFNQTKAVNKFAQFLESDGFDIENYLGRIGYTDKLFKAADKTYEAIRKGFEIELGCIIDWYSFVDLWWDLGDNNNVREYRKNAKVFFEANLDFEEEEEEDECCIDAGSDQFEVDSVNKKVVFNQNIEIDFDTIAKLGKLVQ